MQIRDRQGGCKGGEAVITTAGNLRAKFVIHTVVPAWNGGGNGEVKLLSQAYTNSLILAVDHGIETIAFPNISTGIYHFPKQQAARIAIDTVTAFLATNKKIKKIVFVCYDAENHAIYADLLKGKDNK